MNKLHGVSDKDGLFSKNEKKSFMIVLFGFIGFIALFGIGALLDSIGSNKAHEPKGESGIEECIENGDFVTARQIVAQMKGSADYSSSDIFSTKKEAQIDQEKYERCFRKVSKAQIAFLINDGDFITAQDIALEDNNYDYYLDSFLGKLISLYNTYGLDKVYEGLAQIQMPESVLSYNAKAEQINSAIEGLAVVLVDSNKENAKRLCSLLKPTKDNSDRKSYKEVEAIKKRIGIK